MKECCDESETIDLDDLLNVSHLAKDYGIALCKAAHAEIAQLREKLKNADDALSGASESVDWLQRENDILQALVVRQPCGHPWACVVSSDEARNELAAMEALWTNEQNERKRAKASLSYWQELRHKLDPYDACGCPLCKAMRLSFNYDPADADTVARAVHGRWMSWQLRDGHESRVSSWGEELMLPWDELSEKARDLDRDTVGAVLEIVFGGSQENCNASPLTPTAQRVYNNDSGAARVEST